MSTTFAAPTALTHEQLEEGNVFAPRFDAHGLITAVAQEAGSGRVLMVAHMNAEALSKTIDTGEVHYYSRSRKALWKKGETSGEVQKLIELRTDCDQDVVLLTVEQMGHGAACHTGRKSCFYRVLRTGRWRIRASRGCSIPRRCTAHDPPRSPPLGSHRSLRPVSCRADGQAVERRGRCAVRGVDGPQHGDP
jgi:phosphoribosyl-AMP cyclohydrolase